MAQTILSNKQSTSGSPYVVYTVNVMPSNRTLTTVDLSVQITAHLKNADSSLGTGSGYGIKGKLIVAGQTKWFDGASGNGPIIKGTNSSWSGTGNHTTSAYNYTITGLSWDTTSLSASFYAIRTSGNTSNAGYLKTTDCTAITIEKAAAPSTIEEIVGGGGTTDYTPTIKWSPYDTSFIFKIKYAYGNWSYTTPDFIRPNTTNQFQYSGYTIYGSTVAPYMASRSGTYSATLYTYDSSGNYIGESSANFTVTLNPDTYKPTASISAFGDVGGVVPSSWGIFVAGKSKLSFTVSGSRSDTGASETLSYSTSVNGKTYTTTSITTDWLSSSGSAILTVTDSRGRTGNASSGYSVVAYEIPDIDLIGYRANHEGAAAGDGTYYHYSISGHIQSCKNVDTEKNSVSEIKIGYRIAGSSSAFSYTTISVTMGSTSDNRIAFTAEGTEFGGNLSKENNYEIRAYLKDGLGVESSDSESVGAEFKLLSYKADGTGIAIGKKATQSNFVEVNMNTSVNGDLSVIKSGEPRIIMNTGSQSVATLLKSGNGTFLAGQGTIYFRPNDTYSNVGQAYINTDGKLNTAGEVQAGLNNSYGQFRAICGNYGFFIRNDSSDTYFLLTNSGDVYGQWNGLRPIMINNGNGYVTLGNGATVNGDLRNENGTFTITNNSSYVNIGDLSWGYCHYNTDASVGHWFNKTVLVAGDVYAGSDYNRLLAYQDSVPRVAKVGWANSMGFALYDGQQAFVMLNHDQMAIIWSVSGGTQINKSNIKGSGIQASISNSWVTIKISGGGDFAGFAIISP